MDSEKLSYAVQLIKSGNKSAAIPVLREVILANPKDENAWLWLYSCVEDAEQKKQCLQKALAINPNNQPAQRAFAKLTGAPLPPPQPKAISQPVGKSKPHTKRRPNTLFFAIGAAIAFLFLCMGTSFVLAQSSQFSSMAANLPLFASATLTPSLTPTATATFTPSPTPTNTPTPTPSPTSTPLPTFSPAEVMPIEALESYRLKGKMSMEGIGKSSDIPFAFEFTQEWNKASLAQHTKISVQGAAPNNEKLLNAMSMEMIVIDKTAWVKNGKKWVQVDGQSSLTQQNSITKPFSDLQNLKFVGDETIDGIVCRRYTLDEDSMKMSGMSGQGMTVHALGDVWIANQADLPAFIVRVQIRMQIGGFSSLFENATPDPLVETVPAPTSESKAITYYFEYDVTEVNTEVIIEPPQINNNPENQG